MPSTKPGIFNALNKCLEPKTTPSQYASRPGTLITSVFEGAAVKCLAS